MPILSTKSIVSEYCCAEFAKSQKPGTDNEGYESLIEKISDQWNMGTDLPPIQFCPWCGKRLEEAE